MSVGQALPALFLLLTPWSAGESAMQASSCVALVRPVDAVLMSCRITPEYSCQVCSCALSLDWPLSVFNTGVLTCHQSFSAAAGARHGRCQAAASQLPAHDDEQMWPPDCKLVSEEGTELPAHEIFLFMHSKDLGKMLAIAKHVDTGNKCLQVSWCISAACLPWSQLQCCVLHSCKVQKHPFVCRYDVLNFPKQCLCRCRTLLRG